MTAPMMDNARNGTMGCPAIAAAPATAIRIGVPGIRMPSTATASMIAARNTAAMAPAGYSETRSTTALIQDHMILIRLSRYKT